MERVMVDDGPGQSDVGVCCIRRVVAQPTLIGSLTEERARTRQNLPVEGWVLPRAAPGTRAWYCITSAIQVTQLVRNADLRAPPPIPKFNDTSRAMIRPSEVRIIGDSQS